MHSMDTWIHHDRLIKIKWTTSIDASSSRTTWHNLDASSWIGQTQFKDVNSINDVQFEPLIESNRRIRWLCPNLPIKSKCSSTERLFFDFRANQTI